MFPVDPKAEHATDPTTFLVQDPEMLSKVLPLFSFDPQNSMERPDGHGTAFRIDPWATCATAFHVLEDLLLPNRALDGFDLKPNLRVVALEIGGIAAYGTIALPKDAWRPISGAYLPGGIHTPLTFTDPVRVHNLTELCSLRILPRQQPMGGTPFLPMALRGWQPSLGETVLALGYPGLDLTKDRKKKADHLPIETRLYASFGKIIHIQAADLASSRPWPIIRVDVEWSGGMSGGPVINAAGNVVGLVSTGTSGDTIGTATIFSGWGMATRVFGTVDPDNPGWFGCFDVFDKAGKLRGVGQSPSEVQEYANKGDFFEIRKITMNWQTQEHMDL